MNHLLHFNELYSSIRKLILYVIVYITGGTDVLSKLGIAVFTPYEPYISQYEKYEIAILMDILQQIPLVGLY